MENELDILPKEWFHQGIKGLRKRSVQYPYNQYQINEILKCSNDIVYFCSNYVKTLNIDRGLVLFEPYYYQKEMFKLIENNRNTIFKIPRQSGKTTCVEGYLLHKMLFTRDTIIGVVAHMESGAIRVVDEIQDMFRRLPFWLQCGVVTFSKTDFEIENNSRIICSATSKTALSGNAFSILYVDEMGLIPSNIINDFINAISPTLASSKNSRMLVTSTPKGLNFYAKMWLDAISGKNGFIPYSINWYDVPGRDEKFKEEQIRTHGMQYWLQEFSCDFIGSSDSLITGAKLSELKHSIPLFELYGGDFKIYEERKKDHLYVLSADCAEGKKQDYSAFSVIDITEIPMKQVATYRSDSISETLYPAIINEVNNIYKEDLIILIENNSIGNTVLYILNNDYDVKGYIYQTEKELGLKTTSKSKRIGCATLKSLIENYKLNIIDFNTIEELASFVQVNTTFKAAKDKTDDLAMGLVNFAYLTTTEFFMSYAADSKTMRERLYQEDEKKMLENLPAFGFIDTRGLYNEDDKDTDDLSLTGKQIDVSSLFQR